MNVKEGLYAYLQTKTLLTDLIGTRLFPDIGSQEPTRPYVIYELNDSTHEKNMLAASAFAMATFTLGVIASSSASRNAVKEALRNILHGRSNVVQAVTGGSINFRTIFLQGTSETSPDPMDGSENGYFTCDMVFTAPYFETVPTLV